jgi:hypothetical protein
VRNPLAWAFLIVGLIVGGVVGGFFVPSLSGGRVLPTATPSPGVSVAPEDMLPFHLTTCPTPDCTGGPPLLLPANVKPHVRGQIDIPSNMSVNGGGDEQETSGPVSQLTGPPGIGRAFAITIPEDPKYGFKPQRMQTLYANSKTLGGHLGKPKSYYIVTCYYVSASFCTPPPIPAPPTPPK